MVPTSLQRDHGGGLVTFAPERLDVDNGAANKKARLGN
jgi:hypothetical protein